MYKIKWASFYDLKAIAQVECESLLYEPRLEPWHPSLHEMYTLWVMRYIKKSHKIIVALDMNKNKIVGFLSIDNVLKPYIQTLYVKPDYFRKGVGHELLNYIETYARNKGASEIFLDVEVSNFGAISFYTKHKFVQFKDNNSHLIKMVKEL